MNIKRLATLTGLMAAVALAPALAQADSSRLLDLAAGKRDTGHTVVLSADVKCTPADSYKLWTTVDGVKRFFAPSAKIGEGLGGEYTVAFFPDEDRAGVRHGTAGARVLAMDPPRFFAFEWVVFAGDDTKGDHEPPYAPESLRRPSPLPTWVELTFTPAPPNTNGGTHIEFHHFGFGDTALWRKSQAWFTRAWSGVLASMKQYCEPRP